MTILRHIAHSGLLFLKHHVLGAVISAGLIATGTGAVAAMQLTGTAAPSASISQPAPHHSGKKNARRRIAFQLLLSFSHDIHSTPLAVIGDLKKGESLDTIAGTQAATVRSQLVSLYTKRLGTLVSKGKITSQQEQTRLAAFSTHLTTVMQEPGQKLLAQLRAFLRPDGHHRAAQGQGASPSPGAATDQTAAA